MCVKQVGMRVCWCRVRVRARVLTRVRLGVVSDCVHTQDQPHTSRHQIGQRARGQVRTACVRSCSALTILDMVRQTSHQPVHAYRTHARNRQRRQRQAD
jgi:hypothetical protein